MMLEIHGMAALRSQSARCRLRPLAGPATCRRPGRTWRLARRVGCIERGLLGVGGDRAEGVAGPGGVGVDVVVARCGHLAVTEPGDATGGACDDADPVVARADFDPRGEDEVIPARRVRALECQGFGYAPKGAGP